MTGLNGDTGADADGFAGLEEYGFEGEDIVAEVFAGMGDDGDALSESPTPGSFDP